VDQQFLAIDHRSTVTIRAVILGFCLGLAVSTLAYFNDAVIRQTFLIGNLFPVSVFGVMLVLLLALNPSLRAAGGRLVLRPAELAVITAIGLAACGWPGSNFFRTFTTVLAMPSHWLKTNASWQAAQVMSYVPGGSPLLAEGFVRDWTGLAREIAEGADSDRPGPAARVWELFSPEARQLMREVAAEAVAQPAEQRRMLAALNEVLGRPDFYDPGAFTGVALPRRAQQWLARAGPAELGERDRERLNRWLLQSAFPDQILPAPQASGVLLADGQAHPVAVELLIQGSATRMALRDLPWSVWWPTLRLWGALALLMGLAAVCLALIVHPQWSKRELLPYPVARFVQEVVQPSPDGWLPQVMRSKLFWFGFAPVLVIHTINYAQVWFPNFIQVPLQFDFRPLQQLFPNASRVPMATFTFHPRFYFSVIAFAFFLSTEVSFSLGMVGFAWLAFGALLISQGIPVEYEWIGGKKVNLLLFGAYAGAALMILYVGRRHYLNVAASALGWRRHAETPAYAMWAARALAVCVVLAVAVLSAAGLDWPLSLLLVLLVLLIFVIITRINVETGAFFIQTSWMPVGVLTALFEIQAIGPTAFVVMAIATLLIVGDPREALMPFLANGLHMTSQIGDTPPRRVAPALATMVVAGFVAALCATLYFQYNLGINQHDRWATESMPSMPFRALTTHLAELSAHDELAPATAISGWQRFAAMRPKPETLLWLGLGMTLVIACAVARLRLPWWPLHPVLFLTWSTFPMHVFSASFFVGWLIKAAVVKLAGAKSYHLLKPMMVGVIAAELLAALLWILVGALYFFVTGETPKSYRVFPG
jgi:hypothetical protein